MRIAAIDVGTNTAQLLVAECADGRVVRRVGTDERFVRLGEGVDASGRIGRAALERLKAALLAQRRLAEGWGAEHVVVGATSASRDAANWQEVVDFVRRETGLAYEILSGEEEATWTFAAACAADPDLDGACVVVDIGGGSTEIIVGEGGAVGPEAIRYRRSLNVGSVRFTERFFDGQPPSREAVRRAAEAIDRALAEADVPVPAGATCIGTSGTTEALALVNAGPSSAWEALDEADRTLPADAVRGWCERLLACDFDGVMALHPAAMRGRADVFPMGVLILDRFLRVASLGACRASTYQLRHGLVLRWLHRHTGGTKNG